MATEHTVQWLLPDGSAGGRTSEGTFKVKGALPGEKISVVEGKQRGRTLEVRAFEILAPSPHRRVHDCPVQPRCGGCDLGALDPAVRADQLRNVVARAVRRDEVGWVDSPRATRHRARIKLALGPGGPGYLEPRSHTLVPIDDCPAAREEVAARIESIRGAGLTKGTVEIRSDGQRTVLAFEGTPAPDGWEDCAVKGRTVRGDASLTLRVAGLDLRASPRSFFQVNLEGNALLVEAVTQRVMEVSAERVLDLYAGIGNLSLPIAAQGVPVSAVELEGQATADLRHNAAAHGLDVGVFTGRVERHDPLATPFDVAVLDPPRAGCPGVIGKLLLTRPRRIVLVSCNIVTASRDIGAALEAGYQLTEVTAFDLFPDTHHVEVLLVLDRT